MNTRKNNNTEKIILGIDPGTNVMGYGVIKVMGNKAQLVVMGVIDMRKESDPYLRLGKIFERVTGIIDEYLPDEMAIEAPFFGKNVQSMLKLGRAQGVAIAAAIHHDVPIHEYAPLKIKMAITGQGQASKEQVADMLQGCFILAMMTCRSLWMPPTPWVQPTATFCRWVARRRTPSTIAVGKTSPQETKEEWKEVPS